MKILYIATARMPTEKAHGIQIMKMCEAFSALGHEVELVVPFRRNEITADPFDYYKVARTFKITTLDVPDLVEAGWIGFSLYRLVFGWKLRNYLMNRKYDVLYSRDEIPLWCIGHAAGIRVFEAHDGRWNFIVRAVALYADRIIVITRGLKDFFAEYGVAQEKIIVAPDGVDLAQFAGKISRSVARQSLGLSNELKVVLYTGHLYAWKGAQTLAEAAQLLPGTIFFFVGGTENDCAQFRRDHGNLDNVKILGNKPYSEMPLYLATADVLVLPNSAKEDISRLYTSPMKLFEYMASERPVVSSDLPSLREVLDEKTAVFFEPDNPRDCARAVKEVLDSSASARARAQSASVQVRKYTWRARAENILKAFEMRGSQTRRF